MKKYNALFLIVIVTLSVGCKTKKITTVAPKNANEEIKQEIPCQKLELQDGKELYRGFGIGQSVNEQESISSALDNANAAVAQKIIKLAEITSQKYAQNINVQEKNQFKEQVQRQNSLTSKTFIANAKTICTETYKTADKLFKTYTCIEVDPDAESKYFEKLIKNSADLAKLKYDAAQYEKAHKEAIEEFSTEFDKKLGK